MTTPAADTRKQPDDLERLRAAKGEGWQWPRIQNEPCPQCRFDAASIDAPTLGSRAVELAAAWKDFLLEADDEYLRRIPEPGVNSPLQYAAHVRDILKVYGGRMVLGIEEDAPTVPIFNPPQEVWEEYNRSDPAALAEDIEHQARQLAATVARTEPEQWDRIVVNDRGRYGVYTFTVAGLARNAVHEAHHHLLDAEGTLMGGTGA